MPLDRVLARLRQRITPTRRAAFLACFIAGYLIHLFAFTNIIPNSDGLSRVFDPQQMTVSGRWFLHYASFLNDFTQMPALIGFFSMVFLALAAAGVVTALNLHSRALSAFAGVLMAAFPCLGYTFLYMFTASAYCLAILLAVLAVCLVKKGGWLRTLTGVVLLALAMGIYQAYAAVAVALSLLVGTAAFTTAAQSGNGYLPRQVQPDPALTVTALDPTVVTIPDFDWTGGRGSYEAEILIRWMSAYGQQFYALPEGHPWKAGDVWVVPNVFYGRGNGILGGAGEKDGTDLNVVDLTGKNRYAGTWVTLAIKPAGGIQAVEPLFQGGVPRGTEAFADYVLLQYHVQLICEAGDGQWRHRFSSPSWNTLPPGDPETWTAEQLALWESNLPWGMSMNMEDDTAASRQKAGEDWAESYANHFLTAPNNGNPLKADDVRVGSVTLLSQTADTLSFRVELAFRPIWGTEGAMAFCTLQYGADACALGTGELEGYVTLTLPLTMKRDTDRTSPWIWWTGVRPD